MVRNLSVALVLAGAAVLARPAVAAGPRCASPYEAKDFQTPARPGVVPDVVCMDLQLAQDKLQAAGYYALRSTDGSGAGRTQSYDRNWFVVAQSQPAGRRAPTSTTITLTARRYGDPGAPGPYNRAAPAPIPRLACFDLQEAQDTLQSAGFYQMRSTDARGLGRRQYADRNWTVVNQTPAPGRTSPKNTRITLGAVKDTERPSCGG